MKGNSVSTGYGIGKIIKIVPIIVEEKDIEDVSIEKAKLDKAIQKLIDNYETVLNDTSHNDEIKKIVEIYKMMIQSDSFKQKIYNEIDKKKDVLSSVEKCIKQEQLNFQNMENEYFKERANDVLEVGKNLISIILDKKEVKDIHEDVILGAKEITASDLMSVSGEYVKGIISLVGGKTSHVALLAKSMGIPAIFNVDIDKIPENTLVFIDGYKSEINKIEENEISKYQKLINKQKEKEKKFEEMINKKALTIDGKYYEVCANAANLEQLDNIVDINSDGVGLFRTEFLFLDRHNAPSVEEQFKVYKAYAEKLQKKPLIIRTLDIGGDKIVDYLNITKEDNSFLGYRAVRYCMGNLPMFKDHLKAILMASNYGNVMIMFPMISNLDEIRELKELINEIKKELREEKVLFNEDIKIGIMIEIPSVAVIADLIIDEVDFFSLGTNDLTQYTLAVDRTNEKITHLYNYFDPAVIRLIKYSIDAVPKEKFIGMCGEVAADPYAVILLVGLGLHEFSVNVKSVLKVKKWISLLNYEDCKKVASEVLKFKTAKEVEDYLKAYADIYLKDFL